MQNFQVISGECQNVTFVQNHLSLAICLQKKRSTIIIIIIVVVIGTYDYKLCSKAAGFNYARNPVSLYPTPCCRVGTWNVNFL